MKYWVSYVRAGQLLFEVDGDQEALAEQAIQENLDRHPCASRDCRVPQYI